MNRKAMIIARKKKPPVFIGVGAEFQQDDESVWGIEIPGFSKNWNFDASLVWILKRRCVFDQHIKVALKSCIMKVNGGRIAAR
jgi:hypothetical protein